MVKRKTDSGLKYILILTAIAIAAAVVINPQSKACTEEAKICPDGSAVGRVGPNCEFAACPSCSCPEGYTLEGDVCNPNCYYSTPKCLMPSVQCGYQGLEGLCKAAGGTVTTQLCCLSSSDFPNTCLIGACGCSPTDSHEVKVCDCGENKCWDGSVCVASFKSNEKYCEDDSDCVGAECCHPTYCINKAYKGVCNLGCTAVCEGPLDCGAGSCVCINNRCSITS